MRKVSALLEKEQAWISIYKLISEYEKLIDLNLNWMIQIYTVKIQN